MMQHPVSFRLNEVQLKQLDKIAKSLDRSRAWVIADAIAQYVANYQWQIEEIEKGIADADAGRVYTDEQVGEYFRKRSVRKAG